MATAGKSSKGVKLKMESGATFVAVAEVKDITGPSQTADDLDATSLDSDDKETIAGLVDRGEVTCDAIAVAGDANQTALETALGGDPMNFQIALPEGAGWGFPARVKKFDRKFSTNAVRTISFALKLTGAPTPIVGG